MGVKQGIDSGEAVINMEIQEYICKELCDDYYRDPVNCEAIMDFCLHLVGNTKQSEILESVLLGRENEVGDPSYGLLMQDSTSFMIMKTKEVLFQIW